MNFINLSHYYRLYTFSDYQSMKEALPYLRGVVLAERLEEVPEPMIKRYLLRMEGGGYKNYLEPISSRHAKPTAAQSFISALQMLYKSNGFSAKYVVVERR